MKKTILLLLTSFVVSYIIGKQQLSIEEVYKLTECRDPFLVEVQIDDERVYKEEFGKSPYVFENLVYILPGESFYIDAEVRDEKIVKLSYSAEKKENKKQIFVKFWQQRENVDQPMMMLKIHNPFEKALVYKAGMLLHDREGVFPTNTVPVMPGVFSYEMWHHPIIHLFLNEFEFQDIDIPNAKNTLEKQK